MLLEGLLLGLVWGRLRGGQWAGLGRLQFRAPWLFLVALAVQEGAIAATQRGWWAPAWFGPAHALALTLLAAGLWLNRHLPGLGIVALGVAMNAVPIAWHGGRMPVAESALMAAGLEPYRDWLLSGTAQKHMVVTGGSPVLWLGDWIPLRPPYYFLRQVASPGDLVQMLGLARLVAASMLDAARKFGGRRRLNSALDPAPEEGGV